MFSLLPINILEDVVKEMPVETYWVLAIFGTVLVATIVCAIVLLFKGIKEKRVAAELNKKNAEKRFDE